MCGILSSEPCFRSVFGVSLKRTLLIVGFIQLFITIIATILNIIKSSSTFFDSYSEECEGKDICIGPLIKYSVFDAFFGIACSLLLIFGAKRKNKCLLVFWMIITFLISIKYIYVVVGNDWTATEDWISITYLLFYALVYAIIFNFFQDCKLGGIIHGPNTAGPSTITTTTTLINQPLPVQTQQQYQQGPPPQQGYPPQQAYPPQQGYAQPGYQPQQGYPPQQLYAQQPAYAPQQGYPPSY
eukprot:GFUD01025657.1.p1 GENE.GFUD01025657.1~~GFUD01025657.1.p1  ORF type:complete len:241 (+),score=55.99 GFUD01025657.1:109-831(+)